MATSVLCGACLNQRLASWAAPLCYPFVVHKWHSYVEERLGCLWHSLTVRTGVNKGPVPRSMLRKLLCVDVDARRRAIERTTFVAQTANRHGIDWIHLKSLAPIPRRL